MSDRLEFREKLGGILQKAQGAQNVLSVREVEEYFAEDGLSREQMELVCDYDISCSSFREELLVAELLFTLFVHKKYTYSYARSISLLRFSPNVKHPDKKSKKKSQSCKLFSAFPAFL